MMELRESTEKPQKARTRVDEEPIFLKNKIAMAALTRELKRGKGLMRRVAEDLEEKLHIVIT